MKPIIFLPTFAAVLLLSVALNSFGADAPEVVPAPTAKAIQQWEHLSLKQSNDDRQVGGKINELGRAGWELVAVTEIGREGIQNRKTYYFKRPL